MITHYILLLFKPQTFPSTLVEVMNGNKIKLNINTDYLKTQKGKIQPYLHQIKYNFFILFRKDCFSLIYLILAKR